MPFPRRACTLLVGKKEFLERLKRWKAKQHGLIDCMMETSCTGDGNEIDPVYFRYLFLWRFRAVVTSLFHANLLKFLIKLRTQLLLNKSVENLGIKKFQSHQRRTCCKKWLWSKYPTLSQRLKVYKPLFTRHAIAPLCKRFSDKHSCVAKAKSDLWIWHHEWNVTTRQQCQFRLT